MKRFGYILLLSAILLSALSFTSEKSSQAYDAYDDAAVVYDRYGAIVQYKGVGKTLYLLFSADSTFEGAPFALNLLRARGIKASFFFTGRSLQWPKREALVRRIMAEGHYVGGHSHNHLQYADWNEERTTLISQDSIIADLEQNYAELARYGIDKSTAPLFLPPYEWYNAENVDAISQFGIKTINFSPMLWTSYDFTTPDMPNYWTSDSLQNQLYDAEHKTPLDGAMILIHLGTHPSRTDKFYYRLGEILDYFISRGYRFSRL